MPPPRAIPGLTFMLLLLATGPYAVVRSAPGTAPTSLWSRELTSDVEGLTATALGPVLVQTKAGVTAIEPATGRDVWTRADALSVWVAPSGSTALVGTPGDGRALIDVGTGRDRLTLRDLQLTRFGGSHLLPDGATLLVWGSSADRPHSLVALDLDSGTVRWRQDTLFSAVPLSAKASKVRYFNAAADSGVVVTAPSAGGLLAVDSSGGRLLWRAADKALLQKNVGSGAMTVAGGRVFLGHRKDVYGIDAAGGRFLWKANAKFPRPVVQMELTPRGLLVRGSFVLVGAVQRRSWDPYLALLDPATGAAIWSTRAQKTNFDGRSAFVVDGDRILIAHKTGLQVLDLATGRELLAPKLAAAQGEDPCCLEIRGDRVLISSRESVRLVDRNGTQIYQRYYKAPGASFLAKFAAVGWMAAQGVAASQMPFGGLVDLGSASVFTRRFGGRRETSRSLFLFTESPDGTGKPRFSLVRLAKDTGEETGRIFFTERNPTYTHDPATDLVVAAGGRTIYASAFPAPGER